VFEKEVTNKKIDLQLYTSVVSKKIELGMLNSSVGSDSAFRPCSADRVRPDRYRGYSGGASGYAKAMQVVLAGSGVY
jgi:hypothetical protein